MVAESSKAAFFFLSPAKPTFPRSLRSLFRSTFCSQSPRHSPGEGSGFVRLRQPIACWELKFLRFMQSLSALPRRTTSPLMHCASAPAKGGGRGEEEGAGGRRRGGEGARSGSAGGSGRGRWRQRLADSSLSRAEADTSVERSRRSSEHQRRHRDPRLRGGGRRTGRREGGDAGSHGGA